MEKAVHVYSRNLCQPCRAVKRFLDDNDIPFTETNTSLLSETKADEVRTRLLADGHMQAPVVYVYGIDEPFSFAGFDPGKLGDVKALFATEVAHAVS